MTSRKPLFRVWDKENHRMVYNPDLLIVDQEYFLIEIQHSSIKYSNSHIVVMQHIGLRDKNATEIYEGDIVAWQNNLFLVQWDSEKAQFDFIPQSSTATGQLNQSRWESREWHVVGNCIENAALWGARMRV